MEKHQQSDQNTRMISTESTVVQQQDRCRVLHNIGIESSPHSSGDACFLNDKQSALSGDSIGEPAKMEIKKCTSEKLFRLLQSSQAKAEEEARAEEAAERGAAGGRGAAVGPRRAGRSPNRAVPVYH